MLEQGSRLLSESDISERYPGFATAVARVSGAILPLMRGIRSDADIVLPPILLCDAQILNRNVKTASRNSTRENNNKRFLAHYQPLNNCVYVSSDELQQLLKGSRRQQVSVSLAEEYLHAETTVGNDRITRVGFSRIKAGRVAHGLEPGKIYDHKLSSHPKSTGGLREDEADLRLTENATRLSVHLLLADILPFVGLQYSQVALIPEKQRQRSFTFPKDKALLQPLLEGLYTGRREPIKGIFSGRLLQALDTPNTAIVSFRTTRGETDIFPII